MSPEGLRRFLLVRHGETAGNSAERYHGSNDVPLSELGRAQVRSLIVHLAQVRPVAVVCSPLSRASESAAILTAGCGYAAAPRPLEGLREISFGACEGLTALEIEVLYPEFWRAHGQGQSAGFPEGEPFAAFRARVRAAFAALCAEVPAGDVVVVAHRGVVRQGLRYLLGVAEAAPDRFGVDLGSLTVVRGGPPGGELEQFNVRGEVA